jgi:hypothetical protein
MAKSSITPVRLVIQKGRADNVKYLILYQHHYYVIMFSANDYDISSQRKYYSYCYGKDTYADMLVVLWFLEYCLSCVLREYTAPVPGNHTEFNSWYLYQKILWTLKRIYGFKCRKLWRTGMNYTMQFVLFKNIVRNIKWRKLKKAKHRVHKRENRSVQNLVGNNKGEISVGLSRRG